MAKVFEQWTVLPHEPIVEHQDNFWTVRGTMPQPKVKRVMSIARLQDGRLVVHNAVALDEPEMKKLEAWGTPAFLIVPGGFHRQDAKIWKLRYPQMKVLCPEGAKKNVGAVVAPEGTYEDLPADPRVKLATFAGMKKGEGYLSVQAPNGDTTIVVNDAICNMPKASPLSFTGLFMAPTGVASVPRVMRMMLMNDKRAFRAQLEALAADATLKRVVLAHGAWLERPATELREIAARL
ncbi:MAG: hypothetical protein IT381_12820 [Deltaproteobacteria bacterium]|nr:hypothetical protein [Deltaproteobacteria bacterium]